MSDEEYVDNIVTNEYSGLTLDEVKSLCATNLIAQSTFFFEDYKSIYDHYFTEEYREEVRNSLKISINMNQDIKQEEKLEAKDYSYTYEDWLLQQKDMIEYILSNNLTQELNSEVVAAHLNRPKTHLLACL